MRNRAAMAVDEPPALLPALGKSTVLNLKGLDKVLLVTAAATNEWGSTKIWPASRPLIELDAAIIAVHLPVLFSRLLPPFPDFFDDVLSRYQIHALHFEPKYVLLLSTFTFLCQDFLGVTPSLALFRHFFFLRLTAPNQCSGCMSILVVGHNGG
ncbi:hypothetical protein D1007_22887 [Hordeum vulgare]|nr:hypothetical protein D1007_22887 [Hordeum vulgare]